MLNNPSSDNKSPYRRKKASIKHALRIKATRELSIRDKIFKFFSLFDMFGVKVSLTYKG